MDMVNVDDVFRSKRETESSKESITILNNLARHALIAIKPQSTLCVYRALCLGNKQVRKIRNSNKYWLPLWQ